MGCDFATAHAKASSNALVFGVHLRPLDEEQADDIESLLDFGRARPR